jgi:uncharacterized membrane protein SpoIIM required for sporulation
VKQGQFESLYQAHWQNFERMLESLAPDYRLSRERREELALSPEEYAQFSRLYRKVCHYHTLAKERRYSSALVDRLSLLVVKGYQVQYRRQHRFTKALKDFFVRDFPRLIRQEWRYVVVAHLLLYVPAVVLFIAILSSPELVYTMMGPQQVENFEQMYDPANRVLGEARDSESNWMMFGYYINNNIGVSFRCFASGIVVGLGTIFFLVYNGLIFGAVAGHLTNMEFQETFWTFVIAHGSFELTAIAFSGAAGLKLGMGVLAPGNLTRGEALKRNGRIAIQIMFGVILMLVAAAFVEAFWSSNNSFSPQHKYFIGALLWAIVAVYFSFGGRRGAR